MCRKLFLHLLKTSKYYPEIDISNLIPLTSVGGIYQLADPDCVKASRCELAVRPESPAFAVPQRTVFDP